MLEPQDDLDGKHAVEVEQSKEAQWRRQWFAKSAAGPRCFSRKNAFFRLDLVTLLLQHEWVGGCVGGLVGGLEINWQFLICTEVNEQFGSLFEARGLLTKVAPTNFPCQDSNQAGQMKPVKTSPMKLSPIHFLRKGRILAPREVYLSLSSRSAYMEYIGNL